MATVPSSLNSPSKKNFIGSNSGDRTFRWLTTGTASIIIVLMVGIAALLLAYSWDALGQYGFGFLTGSTWDPVRGTFGIWPYIYGTLVTSFIGLIIATPISIGAALYVIEYAPNWLKTPVSYMVEMLAAIPSIIYGLWGIFALAPFMRFTVEPFLKNVFGGVPVVGGLFQGPSLGKDLLTGGVILAIMITPTIMAISREVIATVPSTQREGMIGLGATKWETIWLAVLPYARPGLVGAAVLGLGRALGETMAVTLVIGNSSTAITGSLLTPGYTMASAIANQFNEANGDLHRSAIVAIALTLMIVASAVNILARAIVANFSGGPKGARI